MAEEREYIPISQLNDTTSVDQNNDVLIISQKLSNDDQEYVSKKITAADFMLNVNMPRAEKNKIGGFKISDKVEDQEGEQKFVDLNEHNQAFVKVPKADNNTIIEANGKIFVSPALKDLADNADNIVKKNVTNVSIEVKDGQYIAGFEQKNGKIQNVQYRELSGSSGLSVVNTFNNPSSTTVPSTSLTYSNIQAVNSSVNSLKNSLKPVAFTGKYSDLEGLPSDKSGYVDLSSNQENIDGIKTFQKCPCSNLQPDGSNDNQLVNVSYLKSQITKIRHYTFKPLIDWSMRDTNLICADGVSRKWCNTSNIVSYKSVYEDGRYAQYVIPLKQEFTDFKKLLIIPVEYSGGTPDIESRILDTQILDWMLSCNFIQDGHNPRIDSINLLNQCFIYELLFIPYNGSDYYSNQKGNPDAKSTKKRFVMFVNSDYSRPVLEIFGINEEY